MSRRMGDNREPPRPVTGDTEDNEQECSSQKAESEPDQKFFPTPGLLFVKFLPSGIAEETSGCCMTPTMIVYCGYLVPLLGGVLEEWRFLVYLTKRNLDQEELLFDTKAITHC